MCCFWRWKKIIDIKGTMISSSHLMHNTAWRIPPGTLLSSPALCSWMTLWLLVWLLRTISRSGSGVLFNHFSFISRMQDTCCGRQQPVLAHCAISMQKILALQRAPCTFAASVLFQTLVEGEWGQRECAENTGSATNTLPFIPSLWGPGVSRLSGGYGPRGAFRPALDAQQWMKKTTFVQLR